MCRYNEISHSTLWASFRIGNDCGFGFDVGQATDSPQQAADREGWRVVANLDEHDASVLAVDDDGDLIVVADHRDGPWAVRVDVPRG